MIDPRPCFRHEKLLVYPDGRIFDTSEKRYLHNYAGTTSRKGPVVYYYDGKNSFQLSRMVMVYESFIKNGRIDRGEFVDTKDGNPDNVHYLNIFLRKKGSTTTRDEYYDKSSIVGLNGIDEVFC